MTLSRLPHLTPAPAIAFRLDSEYQPKSTPCQLRQETGSQFPFAFDRTCYGSSYGLDQTGTELVRGAYAIHQDKRIHLTIASSIYQQFVARVCEIDRRNKDQPYRNGSATLLRLSTLARSDKRSLAECRRPLFAASLACAPQMPMLPFRSTLGIRFHLSRNEGS